MRHSLPRAKLIQVTLFLFFLVTEEEIKIVRGKFKDIAEWNRMEALDMKVFKELVLKVRAWN